jgi:hypothetical protein
MTPLRNDASALALARSVRLNPLTGWAGRIHREEVGVQLNIGRRRGAEAEIDGRVLTGIIVRPDTNLLEASAKLHRVVTKCQRGVVDILARPCIAALRQEGHLTAGDERHGQDCPTVIDIGVEGYRGELAPMRSSFWNFAVLQRQAPTKNLTVDSV